MYLIGTIDMNLKNLCRLAVLLGFLVYAPMSTAFDRDLTPEEVEKLEANAKSDPQNVIARRFLITHYSKLEVWGKVADYSQGILAELPPATLLMVVKACLEKDDGPGASAAIGAYHGKAPATAETKTYEGLAIAKLAKLEYKDANKKAKATEALEVFKQAVDQWPKDPVPYLGWIATLNEFWPTHSDDILQVYKKLENSTGDYESYLIEKCELFVRSSLWEQALLNCQRSVKRHPGDVDSLIHLAQAQRVKKDAEVAKKTLEQVVEANPRSAKAHIVFAELYMDEKNYIKAAEHYRKSIKIDSENPEAFLGLAKAEFELKKFEEALAAYKNNCRLSRTVASEFKSAEGQLRIKNNPLHIKYKNVMSSCR